MLRASQVQLIRKYVKSMDAMKNKYIIKSKLLGTGSFGKVLIAESIADPSKEFAVKIVSKELLAENIVCFRELLGRLTSISHPCVISYYDVYENDSNIYLIMEYFKGKQLLDLMISYTNTEKG